jgi:uncharacterized membrane protein
MEESGVRPEYAGPRRKILALYVLTLAGSALWLLAVFLAPFLAGRIPRLAAGLYACFSPLCHQIPERSFTLFGYPLAVCARCTGIYAGILAGLLAYPKIRGFAALRLPSTRLFLGLSAPIAADAAGHWLGFWSSGNVLRFLTGFAWGNVLPYYFMTGLGEWLLSRTRKRKA